MGGKCGICVLKNHYGGWNSEHQKPLNSEHAFQHATSVFEIVTISKAQKTLCVFSCIHWWFLTQLKI